MSSSRKTLISRGATVLFAGLMLLSAFMYLTGAPDIRATLTHLGYPPYMLTILGVAKLLGAIALVQPVQPTLREWAYAGFTINLLGATVSHVFSGDPVAVTAAPVMAGVLLAVSYAGAGLGFRRPVSVP